MSNPMALLSNPSEVATPRALQWLTKSKVMAIGWTSMRIWLGAMWIQAGVAKLRGDEAAGFIHNNGVGVKGFAAYGVPAYWWGSFLHGFGSRTLAGSASLWRWQSLLSVLRFALAFSPEPRPSVVWRCSSLT